MLVEVYVEKLLPGAEPVWRQRAKAWQEAMKRLGVRCKILRPETGSTMNRVLAVFEWASMADRDKFWNEKPQDVQTIVDNRKDIYDLDAVEHYYYRVIE
jgi:hypothetical protein